jgi:hypothetical protein
VELWRGRAMAQKRTTSLNLTEEQHEVLKEYAILRTRRREARWVSVSDAIREILERELPRLRNEIAKRVKDA